VRAGALSHEAVGTFVGAHFVSAWRRVGTFQVVQIEGKTAIRQGGNIAVYFCTPDLEVVNAIAGPVNPDAFLREAKWAVETFSAAMMSSKGHREALVAAIEEAHEKRADEQLTCGLKARGFVKAKRAGKAMKVQPAALQSALSDYSTAIALNGCETAVPWGGYDLGATQTQVINGAVTTNLVCCGNEALVQNLDVQAAQVLTLLTRGGRNMHEYLGGRGLPKLESIAKEVFETVLGEVVSDQPVSVTKMDDLFENAGRCSRLRGFVCTREYREK